MECSLQGTPVEKGLLVVRIATGVTAAVLVVCSFLGLLASIASLAPSSAIVSFYTLLGAILVCLAELQFGWFLSRATLFQSRVFRGFFYMFIGSLTFATFSFDTVLSIILCIDGGALMVVGVGQIAISCFVPSSNTQLPSADKYVASDFGGGFVEGESTFNPDDYMQPSYATSPEAEVATSYDPFGSASQGDSTMQYAQAAAGGGADGSGNYGAYESF